MPIQIAVFIAYPYPKTVAGWYMLLQDKPLVGLVDLDLVLVVDNVLLVVIALALTSRLNTSVHLSWPLRLGYGCSPSACSSPLTRRCRCSSSAITSQRPTDEQRSQAGRGGSAANWEGSAFQVSYVVGQLSGILIAIIMLQTRSFGRLVPYALIIGNVVGFGYYLPRVGLAVSAFSGVVLWVWYIAITRSFLKLGRNRDSATDRGSESG